MTTDELDSDRLSVRLPDFIVIGAAKSGTTTMYSWLRQQPDVFMCTPKEPRFFSRHWDQGIAWYASLFEPAPPGALLGEASPQYTTPEFSDVAATRMVQVVPDARLVYLVRHPIDRLVSHYRYRRRRAQLNQPLIDIVTSPDNFLVGTSLYHARLAPHIDAFPRTRSAWFASKTPWTSRATGGNAS